MKRILILFCTLLATFGCRTGSKTLLPNVSGKAGEVVVVIDKDAWEGDLGTQVRDVLAGDCPYLAQREPMYSLVHVAPTGFASLFKVHRNIVIFNIDSSTDHPGMIYRSDVWARPQCIIQLTAASAADALELFRENSGRILATLEQAERDRIITNAKIYEERSLYKRTAAVFGGSPHFPSGYKWKTGNDHFIWIADEKMYSNQGVFLYKYPAAAQENFTVESIIAHRNAVLKENVPGMLDGSYMTTSTFIPPTVEFIRFRGRQFAQARGFWEVYNDFMGGPFVSHSFYSPDGRDIIVVEAFVYAPRYDKRHYLRQVESIIYSFEWQKEDENP